MLSKILKQMLADGASAEQIVSVACAGLAEIEEKQLDTREKNRKKNQRWRDRHKRLVTVIDRHPPSPPMVSPITPSLTPPSTNGAIANGAIAPINGTSVVVPTLDADLFRRGKEILGKDAGGLIARLKKAKGGSVELARAAIETAATKQNAREFIGRIVAGKEPDQPRNWAGIEGVL